MLIAGNVMEFKEHSNFENLKDFNNNINMFLACHKKDFTPTEYILFRRLTKFAVKMIGVANTSIKKFLSAVKLNDSKVGASESTFQRMKRKAIKLGILEVYTVHRKNQSQSSNLYVFKRFDRKHEGENCAENQTIDIPQTKGEQVKPARQKGKIVKQLTPHKTNINSKTNNNYNTKRIEEPTLDYTYTADYVPKEFVQTVRPFFNQAKEIEEYWRMVKIDVYSIKDYLDDQTILFTAIHSFKQMISKLKKGKVENPIAYFKGIVHKKFDQIYADLPLEVFNKPA